MTTLFEGKLSYMIELKDRKVLVVGLGLSGVAAAKFLKEHGAEVRCTDSGMGDRLNRLRLELAGSGISVEIGEHTAEFFADAELVVTSPGVPPRSKPIAIAEARGVPVISEIELASQFCTNRIVAITGTNGKSTTATLLHKVLQTAGTGSRLCGNIGFPLVEQVTKAEEGEILVTELSSFQLERITDFKPYISMVLNITPDHLDRYSSIEEYMAAKFRILENQDENCFAVLNEDLKAAAAEHIGNRTGPRLVFFGRSPESDVLIDEEKIVAEISDIGTGKVLRKEIKFLGGEHNSDNIAAVLAASVILGVDANAVRETLAGFRGLEHRLEFVDEINGVRYINDSKATTVESVISALDTVGKRIILIAGGRTKGSAFSSLRVPIQKRAKAVVLIGEAANDIAGAIHPFAGIHNADSMHDAIERASEIAGSGDTVLLSPACASYDMYKNFEDRGKDFKDEVKALSRRTQETIN